MRWTRQRFARDGIAGLVERLVSDQQHADERCCCVRRSRVVLTSSRFFGLLKTAEAPENKGVFRFLLNEQKGLSNPPGPDRP
jgi:hypothetical protein